MYYQRPPGLNREMQAQFGGQQSLRALSSQGFARLWMFQRLLSRVLHAGKLRSSSVHGLIPLAWLAGALPTRGKPTCGRADSIDPRLKKKKLDRSPSPRIPPLHRLIGAATPSPHPQAATATAKLSPQMPPLFSLALLPNASGTSPPDYHVILSSSCDLE